MQYWAFLMAIFILEKMPFFPHCVLRLAFSMANSITYFSALPGILPGYISPCLDLQSMISRIHMLLPFEFFVTYYVFNLTVFITCCHIFILAIILSFVVLLDPPIRSFRLQINIPYNSSFFIWSCLSILVWQLCINRTHI